MKFNLELEKLHFPFQIGFPNKMMLIGSCFTTQIAEKFNFYKYPIFVNPHGILFNPYSILGSLKDCLHNVNYSPNNLWKQEDIFHSWNHHSDFSNLNEFECIQKINLAVQSGRQFLAEADVLILTFGSAFVYELKPEFAPNNIPIIVANNHQAPENWFEKKIYQSNHIFNDFSELFSQIFQMNPKLQIVLTISPVRHLREGVIKNNLSKAHLIQAVHQLVSSNDRVHYFPSYEIAIDILRDYRYYAEDLVHPNYQATQYIWEVLMDALIPKSDVPILAKIKKIQDGLKHKPRFSNSKAYLKFKTELKKIIEEVQAIYPEIDFS